MTKDVRQKDNMDILYGLLGHDSLRFSLSAVESHWTVLQEKI